MKKFRFLIVMLLVAALVLPTAGIPAANATEMEEPVTEVVAEVAEEPAAEEFADEEPVEPEEPTEPTEPEEEAVSWSIQGQIMVSVGQTGEYNVVADDGSEITSEVSWSVDEDIFAGIISDSVGVNAVELEFRGEGTVTLTASDEEGHSASIIISIMVNDSEEPGEEDGEGNGGSSIPVGGESGECGDSATWTLTADGTLTISGTGSTADYLYEPAEYSDMYYDGGRTSAPWGAYSAFITSVVVEEGITRLGEFALFNLFKVTSVQLPSTLKEVGNHSMQHMMSLTVVDLPAGIERIGLYAFYGTPIRELTIPAGLQQMAAFAFSPPEKLYVDSVEQWLTIERLPDEYGDYTSPVYEHTTVYFGGELATDVVIPQGITEIVPGAFQYISSMTSVTIPDSVTSIGEEAFWGCDGLKHVVIPNSVTYLGNAVFRECEGLETVDLPDEMWEMPRSFFADCPNLRSVDMPDTVYQINYAAFDCCEKLVSFNENNSLANIEYIDGSAFFNCKSLVFAQPLLGEKLYYLGSDWHGYTFANCPGIKGKLTIPGNTYAVYWTAFMGCDNLEEVVVEEGVTMIGSDAFWDCAKLQKVNLAASVSQIETAAFDDCPNLTALYIQNPDCEIAEPIMPEHQNEYRHAVGTPGVTVLYGHPGSTAEAYAQQYGFTFKNLPETCEFGFHEMETKTIREATCTENGIEETACANCGKSEGEVQIPAAGHTLKKDVCTVCGKGIVAHGKSEDKEWAWALDTEGTLTLYAICEYWPYATGVYWEDYADQITKIEFSDTIAGHGPEWVDDNMPTPVYYPNLTTIVVGQETGMSIMSAIDAPKLANFEIDENNVCYGLKDGVLMRYMDENRPELIWYPANLTATTYRTGPISFMQSYAMRYADKIETLYVDATTIFPETFDQMDSLKDLYILFDDPYMDEPYSFGDPAKVTVHATKGTEIERIAKELGYKFVELTQCDISGHPSAVIKNDKAATCTEPGYTGDSYCGECGVLLNEGSVIPANGHAWVVVEEKDGNRIYVCSLCEETKTQPLPPKDMDVEMPEVDQDLMDSVLTPEEQEMVAEGATVDIYLDVTDISTLVSTEEKVQVAKLLGNHKVGIYLDINLMKQVGNVQPMKVTETDGEIQITIKLPAQLLNTDKNVNRSYRVIRVHEGVAEVLEGVFDQNNKTFTFATDSFSTYAITYVDIPVETPPAADQPDKKPADQSGKNPAPDTGDNADILLWTVLLVASAAAAVTVCTKKKYI